MNSTPKINQYTVKPQQYDFIGACEQFVAYVGGIGTGKSFSLIAKALFHSEESPGNLGIIVRKNFTDLRDSTMKDYETYTGRKINESKKEDVLPNGSVILFRHGDELPTLKNINAGWFGIEQAEEFGDSTTWDMLIMRLRRQCKHRTGFLIANANGHNWIWKKFIENGPPENHRLIEAKTHDFADILPPDYIKNLEANLPAPLFRRYVLNSHEQAEGLVYSEFRDTHIIDPFEIPVGWERGFVLDHGFRNPTAVLWYAIDHDGNVFIYDEHYQKEKPISEHAQAIKDRKLEVSGFADPSIFAKNQQKSGYVYSIADEYQELGISLIPSQRQEEHSAIMRVNEFMKAGRIKIFRSCTNTINEIMNWKWKARKPGDTMNDPETPEDKDNHAADCIKYLITSRFGVPDIKKDKAPYRSYAQIEQELELDKQLEDANPWMTIDSQI